MKKTKLGLAICGSFCTFDKLLTAVERLADKYDITFIMSETAAETDTRFGSAENFN